MVSAMTILKVDSRQVCLVLCTEIVAMYLRIFQNFDYDFSTLT